jgi:nucleoside-diphosphate-sugar epimerase
MNNPAATILVTGSSGFIGSRLVAALRRRGEIVATHSTREGDLAERPPGADAVRHVYHLAGRTFVPDSWIRPADFYRTNVLGTVNVLEYCRRNGASLTLVSSYVYGTPQRLPVDENHPLHPANPYAHTKLLAEETAQFYRTTFGIPVTIVRPFNPYGPGQPANFLVPTLIRQALSPDSDSIVVEDLRPRRDYVFVDDVVDLLMRLPARGTSGSAYNAGSGRSVSVEEVARAVSEVTGGSKPVVSRNNVRLHEVADTVADISRARDELGWEPRTTLHEGLRQVVASMYAR